MEFQGTLADKFDVEEKAEQAVENLFGGYFSLEWFVYSQTIAYAITAVIALVAVLHRSGRLQLNWNVPFFIMIIKKSLPFALLVLLMSFYNRIDPVLIERLLPEQFGEQQSGVYAQAFRLLDAGQNFAFLFAVLLLPLFSKMIKEKISIERLTKLAFSIIISGSLIIAITSSFYGKELMLLMYSQFNGESTREFVERINDSADIFGLLMFSFVAISSNYIFGTLLTANNSLRHLNWIALTGLILNIGLNLILIPRMNALGSAYASLATQGTTAVLQLFFAFKLLKIKLDIKLIGSLFITVVLLVITGYTLKSFPTGNWIFSVIIMISTGLILAFIFRLLNIKEFLQILKSE